ncbi:LptA/OstA family protein [Candidatus Latescibacterota bacterium]
MKTHTRLSAFLIVSVLLCTSAVTGQNENNDTADETVSGLEFRSGSKKFVRAEDGTFTNSYLNGVEAWTKNRDSELRADAAVYRSGPGETIFYGSAAFRDSTRHLNADTLIYYDSSEEVIAKGNVVVKEIGRTFWADRVNYFKKDNLITAIGGVIVRDDSLRSSITGSEAVFNDSTDYGLITGNPVLEREDDDKNVITITCSDSLEIIQLEKTVRLWNDVVIVKDSLRAESGMAVYNDSTEVVELKGDPKIWHVMSDGVGEDNSKLTANSYASGDTISIHLSERKVSGVDILGNALSTTVWRDSTGAEYAKSILESTNMNLVMTDDLISGITAEGTARSYYFKDPSDTEDLFVNEATGDTLYFFFDDGEVTQLRISGRGGGGAKGNYYEFSPVDTTEVAGAEDSEFEDE